MGAWGFTRRLCFKELARTSPAVFSVEAKPATASALGRGAPTFSLTDRLTPLWGGRQAGALSTDFLIAFSVCQSFAPGPNDLPGAEAMRS